LMIHGDCSSRGCYAMTDEQIGEIYSLARESFLGGEKSFQIQAYPFRMTPANMAAHRNNPNMAFWRMIKEGYDHFEVSRAEPKVDVCARHYVFDAVPPGNSTRPLSFNPTGACPRYEIDPTIAEAVAEKEHRDDDKYAQLVRSNFPTAPLETGTDGGMNRVFVAKLDTVNYVYDSDGHIHVPPQQPGRLPPAISPPPGSDSDTTAAIAQPPAREGTALNSLFSGLFSTGAKAEPSVASAEPPAQRPGLFGKLFGSKDSDQQRPAAAPAAAAVASTVRHSKPAPREPAYASAAHSKAATESRKTNEPQQAEAARPQQPPEQQASAFASPSNNGGLISGAQPLVPSGSFNSRWGGFGN